MHRVLSAMLARCGLDRDSSSIYKPRASVRGGVMYGRSVVHQVGQLVPQVPGHIILSNRGRLMQRTNRMFNFRYQLRPPQHSQPALHVRTLYIRFVHAPNVTSRTSTHANQKLHCSVAVTWAAVLITSQQLSTRFVVTPEEGQQCIFDLFD